MRRKLLPIALSLALLVPTAACSHIHVSGVGGGGNKAIVTGNCAPINILPDNSCRGYDNLPGFKAVTVVKNRTKIPPPLFTGPATPAEIKNYVVYSVVGPITDFWNAAFKASHLQVYLLNKHGKSTGKKVVATATYTAAFIDIGHTVQTPCDADHTFSDDMTLAYCTKNDKIYFGVRILLLLWNGGKLLGRTYPGEGEGAVVYASAHEIGHAMQAEIGVKPIYSIFYTHIKNSELEADCLAGVVIAGTGFNDKGEFGTFIQALDSAAFVGDLSKDPAVHHGTPDDRGIALLTGHAHAMPGDCAKKYEVSK